MVARIQGHTFRQRDLVGGHVALDLVNTLTARNADPIDWLDDYAQLLDWAALTGEFDQATLRLLKRRGEADPASAARSLRRTRELRETLLEVLTAVIRSEVAPTSAIERLERHWKDAAAHARFGVSGGHVRLEIAVETSGLQYINHELALRSFEFLRTLPLERTRVCPGSRCGWLFIDRSKGGQRRWCDMGTCGNAAKSRRHYQRKRQASPRA